MSKDRQSEWTQDNINDELSPETEPNAIEQAVIVSVNEGRLSVGIPLRGLLTLGNRMRRSNATGSEPTLSTGKVPAWDGGGFARPLPELWCCGVCGFKSIPQVRDKCIECRAPRVADWMRTASPTDQSEAEVSFPTALVADASFMPTASTTPVYGGAAAQAPTLVQPGLVVFLPLGWQPTNPVAALAGCTYTVGVVTDVRRVPKKVEVCALPDLSPAAVNAAFRGSTASSSVGGKSRPSSSSSSLAGGPKTRQQQPWDGLGLGGVPQRGVVCPVSGKSGNVFVPLVAVDLALLEERHNQFNDDGTDDDEKKGEEVKASDGAANSRRTKAAVRGAVAAAVAQLDLFGLCGKRGCEAVYRVGDGDVAADFNGRGTSGRSSGLRSRDGEQNDAASVFGREVRRRQNAERDLAAAQERKEAAKQRKDWAEVENREAQVKAAASELELRSRRTSPQQLWCPFCLWEPIY